MTLEEAEKWLAPNLAYDPEHRVRKVKPRVRKEGRRGILPRRPRYWVVLVSLCPLV